MCFVRKTFAFPFTFVPKNFTFTCNTFAFSLHLFAKLYIHSQYFCVPLYALFARNTSTLPKVTLCSPAKRLQMLFCCVVSPRCVHNGKEFREGEVYRMDPCWLCQCRGGVSFCSKAECTEMDCQNFYVPEGECCPVCIENCSLSGHDCPFETWRLDECSSCTCRQGRVLCDSESCPPLLCHTPVRKGLDLVVCRAPAGELYVEGETWRLDECSSCTCRQGRVLCDSESCPPLLCHTPVRSRDSCCYTCTGTHTLTHTHTHTHTHTLLCGYLNILSKCHSKQ
uniref:VWFC domain-containing protein n=1 Tax=Sinocyclocheilus grahami TaxID=75366 RepID=A0A672JZN4_SINGR